MDKGIGDLAEFIGRALEKGISRTEITTALLTAGWQTEQIEKALDEYAEIEFPLPVPKPKPYLSAREAFFYLLLFATLYTSAFNFGNLLFAFIDKVLPDPAFSEHYAVYFNERIRGSVSALIVAFPLFIYLSAKISRELLSTPSGRASGIRRWLTYLTLFIAAGILMGDLISLLYNFLGGELTLRFILKSLVVGAIAGTLFIYYFGGLRQEEKNHE
ncbi:MAG: hypothetical protein FJY09_10185 [Chlorobi bacterium]|nr:hypothetical protein [Chlorobiota bacterium]